MEENTYFCIDTINIEINNTKNNKELHIREEKINWVNTLFKLDTGSQCNVLLSKYLEMLKV